MSSTMSYLWDRTKNCGDLRVFLFENVVFVKSVAPIAQLPRGPFKCYVTKMGWGVCHIFWKKALRRCKVQRY